MPHTRLKVLMSPLAASFQCTLCGDCCRGWSVNVDKQAYQTIEAALPKGDNPRRFTLASTIDLVTPSTSEAHARLRHKADGSCVFLEEDNRCYLHRNFGPEVKPQTCRSYPFRPVMRPLGVVAPIALSCTAVRDSFGTLGLDGKWPGPALVERVDETMAELVYDRYSPGAKTRLFRDLTLPVEVLSQVEDRLVFLLHESRLPWSHRLLCARNIVGRLGQIKPGVRITPKLAQQVCDQALAELPKTLAQMHPDVRQHSALLFAIVRESVGNEAVVSRQCEVFGMNRDLTLEERDELFLATYEKSFPEHSPLYSLLAIYLGERLRASNITLRYGLLATVQVCIFGAALCRFLSCGLSGGKEVTRKELLQAIEDIDVRLFHNLRALERFSDVGAGPRDEWLRSEESAVHLALPPTIPLWGQRSGRGLDVGGLGTKGNPPL